MLGARCLVMVVMSACFSASRSCSTHLAAPRELAECAALAPSLATAATKRFAVASCEIESEIRGQKGAAFRCALAFVPCACVCMCMHVCACGRRLRESVRARMCFARLAHLHLSLLEARLAGHE